MQCGQLTTYKCSKAVVGMCCALSHAITVMYMNKWNVYSTRMCFLICSDNAVYRSGPRNVCNVVVNVCYAILSTGVSPPLNIDLSQQQNRKSVCKFLNSDDSDRCRVVQAESHTIAETCHRIRLECWTWRRAWHRVTSYLDCPAEKDAFWSRYSGEHRSVHIHFILCSAYILSLRNQATVVAVCWICAFCICNNQHTNRDPTRIQGWLLMDAEVSPADGAVQNIHTEDIGTIQW